MVRLFSCPGDLKATAPSGGVAQLVERLLCKQEVIGSIPFTSTSFSGQGSVVSGQVADRTIGVKDTVWSRWRRR